MDYLPSYKDDLYLAHHGIKGQKWGVRRFQNPDGSLTNKGKARLNSSKKNSDSNNSKSKMGSGINKKHLITAGKVAAVGALAAYGHYKMNEVVTEDGKTRGQMLADTYGDFEYAISDSLSKTATDTNKMGGRWISDPAATIAKRHRKYGDLAKAYASGDKKKIKETGKKVLKEKAISTFVSDNQRGAYNRYRENGDSKVVAAGKSVFRDMAVDTGRSIVEYAIDSAGKKLFNTISSQ